MGTKWGYIDPKGVIAVTPQFDAVGPFRHGRAAVKLCCGPLSRQTTGDRFGLIDGDGKYVHSPDLLWVGFSGFTGDLAPVRTAEGSNAFVDRSGKVLLAGKFDSITDGGFSEGLAPAASGGKWGFVDTAGEWVINPQFESAGGFADGLAPVAVGGLTGYIDRKGRFVINPRFVYAGEFVEGLAQFMKADAAMTNGLVAEDGHAAVKSGQFEVVGNLSEGLAPVKTEKGWGFIDRTGKIAISPRFDSVDAFQNGLAHVTVADKEAYVTTSGAFVVEPVPVPALMAERARLAGIQAAIDANDDVPQVPHPQWWFDEQTRRNRRSLLGTWRWHDQTTTFLPDGTAQVVSDHGIKSVDHWSIKFNFLTLTRNEVNGRPTTSHAEQSFTILEISPSKITLWALPKYQMVSATRVQ